MKINRPCELCGAPAEHKHHKFSNSKVNRKLYSRKIINMPFNIIYVCSVCHLNRPIPTYNEIEFIEAGEKAGFRLRHLAGKSLQFKTF